MGKLSINRSSRWIVACSGAAIVPPLVILYVLSAAINRNASVDTATASEESTTQPTAQISSPAATNGLIEASATTMPAISVAARTDDASWNPQAPHTVKVYASAVALNSSLLSRVREAIDNSSYQCSPIVGGAFAQFPFQDVTPNGLLIGFRIGLGKFVGSDIIRLIQPIYMTSSGEQLGKGYGMETEQTWDIKAPEGYAVSGATISGGGGLDSIMPEFMRIAGSALDPDDAMIHRRIGGDGGGPSYLGGDGTPVIGICGRYSDKGEYLGLGLVFLQHTEAAKAHRHG